MEQMRLARLRFEVHSLSLAGDATCVAACHQLRLEASDHRGTEDVRVGADLLDHLHRRRHSVRGELERAMTTAFDNVWDLSKQRKVSLRTAAYMVGADRVARATILGGYT